VHPAPLQRPGDQHPHDLVRATVDALMRASRYMPDLVFVHVAVATMELQAGVENVSLQFGGEELG